VEERIDRIIAFSELGDFIDIAVKTYSAGMFVRLGFSIAAHLDADILLIDEILAVGDEGFQRKCLRRISERIAAGTTVVLVSHDASAIERVCERVVVLDGGRSSSMADRRWLLHYHRLMGTEHGGGESVRPAAARAIEVVDVELRDGVGPPAACFTAGRRYGGGRAAGSGRRGARRAHAGGSVPGRRDRVSHDYRAVAAARRDNQLAFEVPSLALLGGDYDLALSAAEGPAGARSTARLDSQWRTSPVRRGRRPARHVA